MSTQTNLEIILDQFENGERRYGEDSNFKSAVDSLKMGLGVYAVLDHYIKENTRLRETGSKSQSLIKSLTETVLQLNGQISERDEEINSKNAYIQKLSHDGRKLDRRIDELVNELAIQNDFISNMAEPKEKEFGECKACGYRDDRTRAGLDLCNGCDTKNRTDEA